MKGDSRQALTSTNSTNDRIPGDLPPQASVPALLDSNVPLPLDTGYENGTPGEEQPAYAVAVFPLLEESSFP